MPRNGKNAKSARRTLSNDFPAQGMDTWKSGMALRECSHNDVPGLVSERPLQSAARVFNSTTSLPSSALPSRRTSSRLFLVVVPNERRCHPNWRRRNASRLLPHHRCQRRSPALPSLLLPPLSHPRPVSNHPFPPWASARLPLSLLLRHHHLPTTNTVGRVLLKLPTNMGQFHLHQFNSNPHNPTNNPLHSNPFMIPTPG